MAEYKVLKDFTFRGAKRVAGETIILNETKLERLTEEGFRDNVELLDGSLPQTTMEENTTPEAPVETPATEEVVTPEATPEVAPEGDAPAAPEAGAEPSAA